MENHNSLSVFIFVDGFFSPLRAKPSEKASVRRNWSLTKQVQSSEIDAASKGVIIFHVSKN